MKCMYLKDNREQCQANAMKEGQYCYLHNPDIPEEEKRQARIRGGETKVIAVEKPLLPVKMQTSKDVALMLEQTINEVRAGDLDPRIANTIGYLAGHLIKAIEVEQVTQKVNIIESVLTGR